jgi:hypothetical protein
LRFAGADDIGGPGGGRLTGITPVETKVSTNTIVQWPKTSAP